jgi:hypothetical protein
LFVFRRVGWGCRDNAEGNTMQYAIELTPHYGGTDVRD